MEANDQGIRKAAQLVASLDVDTADRLLEKLPEPVARRIRELAVGLDDVADTDRQGLLDALRSGPSRKPEWLGGTGQPAVSASHPDAGAPTAAGPLERPPAVAAASGVLATPVATESTDNSPTVAMPESAARLESARTPDGGVVFHGRLAQAAASEGNHPSELRPWSPPRGDARPSHHGEDRTGHAEAVEDDGPPLASLHDVECDSLAEALGEERPQTIAVVLAHLPPDRAAEVLDRLEAGLCRDVVRRLSQLEETDPAILRELGSALQSRLTARLDMRPKRVVGGDALRGILGQCNGRLADRIRETLDHDESTSQPHDATTPPGTTPSRPDNTPADLSAVHITAAAGSSGPEGNVDEGHSPTPASLSPSTDNQTLRPDTIPVEPRRRKAAPAERAVAFERLLRVDDVALARLAARADDRVLLLAMLSATPEWCARVLRVLPPLEADRMARKLKRPGPIRLADLDEARHRLGQLASQLSRQGIIQLDKQPGPLQRAV